MSQTKPCYDVRAWREKGWWLARVVAARHDAPQTPLDSVAHARTMAGVEQAARDLIAVILDVADHTFDVEVEFLLPDEVESVVFEALGARIWLEAAQDLWDQHSATAIRSLTRNGFTPAETAMLLGLAEESLPGAHRAA
jgi:hypothetical protein